MALLVGFFLSHSGWSWLSLIVCVLLVLLSNAFRRYTLKNAAPSLTDLAWGESLYIPPALTAQRLMTTHTELTVFVRDELLGKRRWHSKFLVCIGTMSGNNEPSEPLVIHVYVPIIYYDDGLPRLKNNFDSVTFHVMVHWNNVIRFP